MFVSSKLDYCNALLYGLPAYTYYKKSYNTSRMPRRASLYFTRRHDHITPVLFNLHWLPVNQRIIFKILLITYKVLSNLAPSYICDLLISYTPSRQLRSSSKHLLVSPSYSNLKTGRYCMKWERTGEGRRINQGGVIILNIYTIKGIIRSQGRGEIYFRETIIICNIFTKRG